MNQKQKQVYDQIVSLGEDDGLIVIFELLKNKKLSYTDLSELYVQMLEQRDSDHRDLICELGFSLVMYQQFTDTDSPLNEEEKTDLELKTKLKTNKALVRTRLFKGTPYEKKMLEAIEKDPNKEEDDREDENIFL